MNNGKATDEWSDDRNDEETKPHAKVSACAHDTMQSGAIVPSEPSPNATQGGEAALLDMVETGIIAPPVGILDENATPMVVAATTAEKQEDDFAPVAVEYDLEAKPTPASRKRSIWLCCALMGAVTVAIIGALVAARKQVPPSNANKQPSRSRDDIRVQLELILGEGQLDHDDRAHNQALDWIVDDDLTQLTAQDSNLLQRYLLAVFYFRTHQDGHEWLSCNALSDTQDNYCAFMELWSVHDSSLKYRRVGRRRWLSNENECSWGGLECDELDQLTGIQLTGQGIVGQLPTVLSLLPHIGAINLAWNYIDGTIPPVFAALPHLVRLDLHFNLLSGPLPESWSNATSLQVVNVGDNLITGTIPDDLTRLADLRELLLFQTNLYGTLPSHIAQLSSLESIRIHGAKNIGGSLPSGIGRLSRLTELWAHETQIEGTIPSQIGLIEGMRSLRLHNTLLNGTIPEELWDTGNLVLLDLYNTAITGSLSPDVVKLTDLQLLRLSDTLLSGRLPTELGRITTLRMVWLHGTDFTGEVPSSLCDLLGEQRDLVEITADCLPPNGEGGMGEQRIACGCCSQCCDHETEICQ